MLTKTGVKLLDFGLAKLRSARRRSTESAHAQAALTGTRNDPRHVQYMAPEQLEGKDADARTDIFAFGAVLYEMVTGRRAFAGEQPGESDLGDHVVGSAADESCSRSRPRARTHRPEVPGEGPERRWQTARDLADEIQWVGSRRRDTATHRTAREVARPRWWAWTAALRVSR